MPITHSWSRVGAHRENAVPAAATARRIASSAAGARPGADTSRRTGSSLSDLGVRGHTGVTTITPGYRTGASETGRLIGEPIGIGEGIGGPPVTPSPMWLVFWISVPVEDRSMRYPI
jgi:hypothetical protein